MSTFLITQSNGPQRVVTSMAQAAAQIRGQLEDEFFMVEEAAYDAAIHETDELAAVDGYGGGLVGPLPDGTQWTIEHKSWDALGVAWGRLDTSETVAAQFNERQAHA